VAQDLPSGGAAADGAQGDQIRGILVVAHSLVASGGGVQGVYHEILLAAK
jgi:hypothetical protein